MKSGCISNNKDVSRKKPKYKRTNGANGGSGDQLDQGNILCDKQNLNVEPCSPDMVNKKKINIEWTKELHQKFMDAVTQLGEGNCYPKAISELMNVPNLTRMQVASHLQKCRHDKWRSSTKNKNQSRMNKFSTLATGDEKESNKIKVFGAMPYVAQTKMQNNLPLVSMPSFGNKIAKQLHISDSRNGSHTHFNTPIAYLLEKENVQERMNESQPQSLPPPTFDFFPSISNNKNSSATCYGFIPVAGNGVAPTKGAVNENINSKTSLNISNANTGEFFIEDEEMNFLVPDFPSYTLEKKSLKIVTIILGMNPSLKIKIGVNGAIVENAMIVTRVTMDLCKMQMRG